MLDILHTFQENSSQYSQPFLAYIFQMHHIVSSHLGVKTSGCKTIQDVEKYEKLRERLYTINGYESTIYDTIFLLKLFQQLSENEQKIIPLSQLQQIVTIRYNSHKKLLIPERFDFSFEALAKLDSIQQYCIPIASQCALVSVYNILELELKQGGSYIQIVQLPEFKTLFLDHCFRNELNRFGKADIVWLLKITSISKTKIRDHKHQGVDKLKLMINLQNLSLKLQEINNDIS